MKVNVSTKLIAVTAVSSLLLVTGVARLIAANEAMPQVGQTAPEFTLPSQDGTDIGLKDFSGKWVVLYFYPKDNTPGCTLEAHNFQQSLAKYEQMNAVIVGVSVDSTGSHKEFCSQQNLTFKLLADTDKKVVQEYGSMHDMMGMKMAARNTFLIDPKGKIEKVWTQVNPSHHSDEVLQALTELQGSK